MQEESLKETNIILGILLAILIGINSLAILFIVGVSRVDAAGYVYYNNFSSMGAVNIGSRSEGTITQKTINQACNIGNSGTYCGYYANVNSRYMAIELIPSNEQMIANKYYTITIYYRIATSRNSNTGEWTFNQNYFDASSGVCTGWSGTCFQTQNANATTIMNRLFTANMTLVGEYSNEYGYELQAVYASTIIIKANANGNLYLYLNSNNASNNTYLVLFGAEINYYGDDINSAITNVATTTDITNSTNTITSQITRESQAQQQATQQASENQINSQKICSNYGLEIIETDNKYLDGSGTEQISNYWGISKYIDITNAEIELENPYQQTGSAASLCYYTSEKTKISCQNITNLTNLTIPNGTKYIRVSMSKGRNQPQIKICKNGNQALWDGGSWTQQNPDESSIDSAITDENQIGAYLTDGSDISSMNIEIDTGTNIVIWDIFNRLITGNTLLYSTFLTILFFGLIKTAFAR